MTFQTIYSPICIGWRDLRLWYQNVFTSRSTPCKFIQWYRGGGNVTLPCQDVTLKSLQKNMLLVHRYKLSHQSYLNVNECNEFNSNSNSALQFFILSHYPLYHLHIHEGLSWTVHTSQKSWIQITGANNVPQGSQTALIRF